MQMSRTKTITRMDLSRAVQQKLGLSPPESRHLVEQVLAEICGCMVRGETIKLSGFGSFAVRRKGQRIGRNPATREEVPITPRRVVVFKASNVLKQKVNAALVPPAL
jgi:integration host factor subunit alpha